MSDTEPDVWTNDEEKILRHEAFITEVIRLRNEADPEKRETSTFIRLLGTSGATAFITVVLGGLIGQLIISSAQTSSARRDRRVAEYTQYLTHQQETVNSIFTQVGKIVGASESKISLTREENQVESVVKEDQEVRKNEILELQKKIGKAFEEWGLEQERLGLLIRYYHYGQPAVLESWWDTQDCVNQFIECAGECYLMYSRNDPSDKITEKYKECETKKIAVHNSLNNFAATLDQTREYSWRLEDDPSQYLSLPGRTVTVPIPICKGQPLSQQQRQGESANH
jgi:hypothetical protein